MGIGKFLSKLFYVNERQSQAALCNTDLSRHDRSMIRMAQTGIPMPDPRERAIRQFYEGNGGTRI